MILVRMYCWILAVVGTLGFSYLIVYVFYYEDRFENLLIDQTKNYIAKETRIFYDNYVTDKTTRQTIDYFNKELQIEAKIPGMVETVLKDIKNPQSNTNQILQGLGLMQHVIDVNQVKAFILEIENYIKNTYLRIKNKVLWDIKVFLGVGLGIFLLLAVSLFTGIKTISLSLPVVLLHIVWTMVGLYVFQSYAWFADIIANQFLYTYYYLFFGIAMGLYFLIILAIKIVGNIRKA